MTETVLEDAPVEEVVGEPEEDVHHLACPVCTPTFAVCGSYRPEPVFSKARPGEKRCEECDDPIAILRFLKKHDTCKKLWEQVKDIHV